MSAEKEIRHLLLVTKIRHAYYYEKNVCSTSNSRAVSHPSTTLARRCLTSVFRWELVLSTWYGRRRRVIEKNRYFYYCHCIDQTSSVSLVEYPTALFHQFKKTSIQELC